MREVATIRGEALDGGFTRPQHALVISVRATVRILDDFFGEFAVDRGRERTKAEIALQLEHMLAPRGVAAVQILVECGWVDAQLTGEHGQDLRVSALAHVSPWEVRRTQRLGRRR